MKKWFSKKRIKDDNSISSLSNVSCNNKGMKDVLNYLEDESSVKEQQLNRILMYAQSLIGLSHSDDYKNAETQPIFSYIKLFTDFIQTKNAINILSNTDTIFLDNNGSNTFNIRAGYHHTVTQIFMEVYKNGNYNLKELGDTIKVRNGKDPIVTEIWESSRLTDNIGTIGKGIKRFNNDDNYFRYQELNHVGIYLYPLGIVHVENGNHSINAGMIKSEGHFYVNYFIDISEKYGQYYFDGINLVDKATGEKQFIFFELGVIFEIGRLLVNDSKPFPNYIQKLIEWSLVSW